MRVYQTIVLVAAALLGSGVVSAQVTQATIQAQFTAACAGGGTVTMPPSMTFTTTFNLRCPAGNTSPITLRGAPTRITCQTGSAPCIIMGNDSPPPIPPALPNHQSRENLALRDVMILGSTWPAPTGSIGLQLLPSADNATISDAKVAYFDTGIHLYGDTTTNGLLTSVIFENIKSGFIGASVNTAIHLEGVTANIFFNNFFLAAQRQAIVSDGDGGSGSSASFTNGTINTTLTPGVPSIYVGASDGSIRALSLSQIQDWEVPCPILQMGDHANVFISQVTWQGDPWGGAGAAPVIDMLPNTISWLRLDEADLAVCSGSTSGDIIKVQSTTSQIRASNSSFYLGKVNFVAAAQGAFVGNSCATYSGPTLVGNLTRVRASANIANASNCMPDR